MNITHSGLILAAITNNFKEYYRYIVIEEPELDRNSILALDDDYDVTVIIRMGLGTRGLNVLTFTSPNLALEHFKSNAANYSLVISDLRMPGMNGFEFIKKVKEINPDIKVFLMTAFEINNLEFSNAISSLKVDEFITKPITIEKLTAMVEKHIGFLKTK